MCLKIQLFAMVTGNCGIPYEERNTVNWFLDHMQFSVDPESYHKKVLYPNVFESLMVQY